VNGVFAAEPAVLVHFKPVGGILFVLRSVVIALLAFVTSESYFNSHCVSAPPLFQANIDRFASLLYLAEVGFCLHYARKMNPSADR